MLAKELFKFIKLILSARKKDVFSHNIKSVKYYSNRNYHLSSSLLLKYCFLSRIIDIITRTHYTSNWIQEGGFYDVVKGCSANKLQEVLALTTNVNELKEKGVLDVYKGGAGWNITRGNEVGLGGEGRVKNRNIQYVLTIYAICDV